MDRQPTPVQTCVHNGGYAPKPIPGPITDSEAEHPSSRIPAEYLPAADWEIVRLAAHRSFCYGARRETLRGHAPYEHQVLLLQGVTGLRSGLRPSLRPAGGRGHVAQGRQLGSATSS